MKRLALIFNAAVFDAAVFNAGMFSAVMFFAVMFNAGPSVSAQDGSGAPHRPPNIVYILADDLGYGELGCYGQTKIRTPRIDALAAEGMRFTQHYSGNTVCAPSRCVLLTGKHTGHSFIRDNQEVGGWGPDDPEGQYPLADAELTVAEILRAHGYATACVGKWGLGGPDSEGHPNRQGFDLFYGYLCQRVAHNYYPTHLWRNGDKDLLGNDYFSPHQKLPEDADPTDPASYARYRGKVYAPDRMIEEALGFVREHRAAPFFLYFASPVPHAAIQVPEASVSEYDGALDDKPYPGGKGYLPNLRPHAAYAAMITRFDRDVGQLLDLLGELGLANDTLVIVSSDNGTTFNGGTDAKFFDSVGGLRGLKCSLYEGGIRVPMIARWPGRIAPGTTSDHVSAFWDFLPTVCDLVGAEKPGDIDGLSLLPTLTGRGEQKIHDHLYWEFAASHSRAVRMGKWKAVWRQIGTDKEQPLELYDLDADRAETRDVAADHPDVVQAIRECMARRTPAVLSKWEF